MLDTTLPLHALTGLRAVGWRKPRSGEDGPQPIWPILGGAPDGDEDGDQQDDADESGSDQDDDRDGDAQDDDEDLGDAGKKALRALRKENRQLKAQLRQGPQTGGGQKPAKKDDGSADADAVREQAREEARAEVWTERVEAAAIAAAAGRLANPQLAARLLDLSDIPKNDKGRPDRDAITELIDELLEDEPYLAAQSAKDSGRRFQGDADGGARKAPKKTAATLGEAVAARLAGKSGRQ